MVNIETSCDELSEKKRKTNVVRFEASEHERNKVDLRKHESKDGKLHSLPLYCVAFSKDKYFDDSDGREFFCFATCGDLKVVIYEVEANNPDGIFRAKQTYRENKDIDEQFNTCVFAGRSRAASRHSEKGPQLLMIGGRSGIIRAIDTWQNRQISELEFNTAEIFDLKVCPSNEYLLLSCADDGNICLWNLESFACAAVFGGKHGHEHAVLSISWHPLGLHFASGGKDRTVRLWRIDGDKVSEAIEASKGLGLGLRQRFRPFLQNFPYFVTGKLHPNYVRYLIYFLEI
jgi:WD40 repeat protein